MSQTLAAVDLGSNSFRMVIARVVDGGLQMIDGLRDGVRLAASLDSGKMLSEEGQQRALATLGRFEQRIRDVPSGSVRAVGTNTLRQARNRDAFLKRAEETLGHPIEVVSGQEEARLIYLGVSHSMPASEGRRLVVDIGGGSTECVIGRGFDPELAESLYMGCVSYSQRFFPEGRIDPESMMLAETAAALELSTIRREYRSTGWSECAGSSGTIHAINTILRENDWSPRGITLDGMTKLRERIIAVDHTDRLKIKGLLKDRARVIPGGLAILMAVFESLGIEKMEVSSGAMREGVLYDLLGRIRHEDVREATILRFVSRYNVDLAQAKWVEDTALSGLEQVGQVWGLPDERSRLFLTWAARLHEIGLAVAHSGFHKHGYYLIANSDMPGFSIEDQSLLALLVRGHRRSFPDAMFEQSLMERARGQALRLCAILRIAVLLNRSRSRRPLPRVGWEANDDGFDLTFPSGWLEAHPLTLADLEMERGFLASSGIRLDFS